MEKTLSNGHPGAEGERPGRSGRGPAACVSELIREARLCSTGGRRSRQVARVRAGPQPQAIREQRSRTRWPEAAGGQSERATLLPVRSLVTGRSPVSPRLRGRTLQAAGTQDGRCHHTRHQGWCSRDKRKQNSSHQTRKRRLPPTAMSCQPRLLENLHVELTV